MPRKKRQIKFVWSTFTELPSSGGKAHIGVAGPLTGVHNGVMIIAGGANFPAGKPWEGGKKVYNDDIFVLEKDGKSAKWISPKTDHLNQKIAYAACTSVSEGVICIGGETESGAGNHAFIMRWDAMKQDIIFKTLPDLPVPVANAGAASIGNIIYVAGGESKGKPSKAFFSMDLSGRAVAGKPCQTSQ